MSSLQRLHRIRIEDQEKTGFLDTVVSTCYSAFRLGPYRSAKTVCAGRYDHPEVHQDVVISGSIGGAIAWSPV